jgi:uncharacterized membrane protein
MTRVIHRLAAWQRALIVVTGLALLFTGLVWLIVHDTIGAGAGELPHPSEAWLMRLHGLASFAALFALGTLAAHHVPHGWRLGARHRHAGQRGTGLVLCTLGALLAATGYALYYFAPEPVRPALGWVHASLGVAMAALLLAHRRSAWSQRHAHSDTARRSHAA